MYSNFFIFLGNNDTNNAEIFIPNILFPNCVTYVDYYQHHSGQWCPLLALSLSIWHIRQGTPLGWRDERLEKGDDHNINYNCNRSKFMEFVAVCWVAPPQLMRADQVKYHNYLTGREYANRSKDPFLEYKKPSLSDDDKF